MIKKIRKKHWYTVKAPKLLDEQIIGELRAFEPQDVIGRNLVLNLMSVTDNPKLQHINLEFSINSVVNNDLKTSIISYCLSASSIRRQVRRGCKRVDDSFTCKTKEDKLVKIKPFLITRANTTNLITSKLRKSAKEIIEQMVSKLSFDKLINDILNHRLQSDLKKQLNKIYPLRICEFRFFGLTTPKKKQLKTKK